MSNYKSSDDAGKGSPNLEHMQYLQDNWGQTEVSASVQVEKIEVTASGSAGVTSTNIPVGAEIIDVVVYANATSGSGTATLSVGGGGSAITDAITMAVLDTRATAGTIDRTFKYATSAGVTVTTNADADLGDVYVFYKK